MLAGTSPVVRNLHRRRCCNFPVKGETLVLVTSYNLPRMRSGMGDGNTARFIVTRRTRRRSR